MGKGGGGGYWEGGRIIIIVSNYATNFPGASKLPKSCSQIPKLCSQNDNVSLYITEKRIHSKLLQCLARLSFFFFGLAVGTAPPARVKKKRCSK